MTVARVTSQHVMYHEGSVLYRMWHFEDGFEKTAELGAVLISP